MVTEVLGEVLLSPHMGERCVSNGVFAMLLALKLEARPVVMSGFAMQDGWFHISTRLTKRNKRPKTLVSDDPRFGSGALSIVVYLAPEQNAGTVLYDNKLGLNLINMEWKQNRALVFARQEGRSWHGYKGDGINNRLALVYNLMTTDIRGVYEAERVSYFATKFKRRLQKLGKLVGRKRILPS